MLIGWCFRDKHLIVKSLVILTLKRAWSCSVIVQNYCEAFKRLNVPKRDQGIFCAGRCVTFYIGVCVIVPRSCLPNEWDWETLPSFYFPVVEFLSIPELMHKTEFRSKVLKVARSKIDVERERGKKTKSDAVAKTVLGESFNPFID